eukprot:2559600-Amphidinium_carterae.1
MTADSSLGLHEKLKHLSAVDAQTTSLPMALERAGAIMSQAYEWLDAPDVARGELSCGVIAAIRYYEVQYPHLPGGLFTNFVIERFQNAVQALASPEGLLKKAVRGEWLCGWDLVALGIPVYYPPMDGCKQ